MTKDISYKLLVHYYYKLFLLSIPFSVGSGIIIALPSNQIFVTFIQTSLLMQFSLSFIISLVINNIFNQGQFYFYFNKGWSKTYLIGTLLLFNLIIFMFLKTILFHAS